MAGRSYSVDSDFAFVLVLLSSRLFPVSFVLGSSFFSLRGVFPEEERLSVA